MKREITQNTTVILMEKSSSCVSVRVCFLFNGMSKTLQIFCLNIVCAWCDAKLFIQKLPFLRTVYVLNGFLACSRRGFIKYWNKRCINSNLKYIFIIIKSCVLRANITKYIQNGCAMDVNNRIAGNQGASHTVQLNSRE